MFPIRSIQLIVLALLLSPHPAISGTECEPGELNCLCHKEIVKAMAGGAPNYTHINNGFKDSSHNKPVTCGTAKFYHDKDPSFFIAWLENEVNGNRIRTWIENGETRTWGHDPENPVGSGKFLGGELFSNTYQALNTGNIIAVLIKAQQLANQTGNKDKKRQYKRLVHLASKYLKGYWAALALMASKKKMSKYVYHHAIDLQGVNKTTHVDYNYGGYSVTAPGTRSYVNTYRGSGLQGVLLSIALESPNRSFNVPLNQSPGFYGGLRSALTAMGYNVAGNGFKVNLKSKSIPAWQVGLTVDERNALKKLVNSHELKEYSPEQSFSLFTDVLRMLRPFRLSCKMTVLRTEEGVIAWFGTSTGSSQTYCNASKGGTQAIAQFDYNTNLGTFVGLAHQQNWPGGPTDGPNYPDLGSTWKQGNKICTISPRLEEVCVDIPGGEILYEVQFHPNKEPRCLRGLCQNSGELANDHLLEAAYQAVNQRQPEPKDYKAHISLLELDADPILGMIEISKGLVNQSYFKQKVWTGNRTARCQIIHQLHQVFRGKSCANINGDHRYHLDFLDQQRVKTKLVIDELQSNIVNRKGQLKSKGAPSTFKKNCPCPTD